MPNLRTMTMSDYQNGGPAFPCDASGKKGMSLRDYFASKALIGLISTAAAPCLNGLDGHEKHTAEAAYRMADAMIKAREVNNE